MASNAENVSIWWRHYVNAQPLPEWIPTHSIKPYGQNSLKFESKYKILHSGRCTRADSRFAPSQWETALLCNKVSHWLGTSLESALCIQSEYGIKFMVQNDQNLGHGIYSIKFKFTQKAQKLIKARLWSMRFVSVVGQWLWQIWMRYMEDCLNDILNHWILGCWFYSLFNVIPKKT